MKWFSRPGLLIITLLGGVVGAELWQRRKLKKIARQITDQGRLIHSAIRITNEIRGSVDIPGMLRISALEVAQTLNIQHCCLSLYGEDNEEKEFACSCGSNNHELDIEAASAAAIEALKDRGNDRFLSHYPNPDDSRPELSRPPVLGLPITRKGDSLGGVLIVLSTNPTRLWLDDEIQLLLAVAHQLSLSISHAEVFATKEQDSLTDFLTGCLNRRGLDALLKNHFSAATERDQSISLIMIDLDHFKAINDNYGHDVGDGVLRSIAGVLLGEAANGALAARVGGEEFALLLSDHSLEEAAAIGERVRHRVESMTMSERDDRITLSCGVASAPTHAQSPEGLFTAADKALYRAKTSGRNRVCVATHHDK